MTLVARVYLYCLQLFITLALVWGPRLQTLHLALAKLAVGITRRGGIRQELQGLFSFPVLVTLVSLSHSSDSFDAFEEWRMLLGGVWCCPLVPWSYFFDLCRVSFYWPPQSFSFTSLYTSPAFFLGGGCVWSHLYKGKQQASSKTVNKTVRKGHSSSIASLRCCASSCSAGAPGARSLSPGSFLFYRFVQWRLRPVPSAGCSASDTGCRCGPAVSLLYSTGSMQWLNFF